jgi:hypothetical protein
VKFLVDAQLPAWLARFLSSSGHDALHTLELPEGNRTTDARIAEAAEGSDRVVVTKDRGRLKLHYVVVRPGLASEFFDLGDPHAEVQIIVDLVSSEVWKLRWADLLTLHDPPHVHSVQVQGRDDLPIFRELVVRSVTLQLPGGPVSEFSGNRLAHQGQ